MLHSVTIKNIRADICPIYTCRKCGSRQEGDRSITGSFSSTIDLLIYEQQESNDHHPSMMPLHWSSHLGKNGKIEYECFKCNVYNKEP